MGSKARATMPSIAVIVFSILLVLAAQQAHNIHATASVSNYKFQQQPTNSNFHLVNLFNRWAKKHARIYNSWNEKQYRFQVFKDNVRYIHSHNVQQKSFWMGLNKFSDLTYQEFLEKYVGGFHAGGFQAGSSSYLHSEVDFIYKDVMAEPNVDWRNSGAVSEVKNQGQCGSCWTFSTTGAIEAVNYIATGEMITLSEQELLDCDSPPNHGCQGGFMQKAFEYVYENGGIRTENEYPYKMATNFECVAKKNSTVVSIDGYAMVPTQSESSLLKAVSMNPKNSTVVSIDGYAMVPTQSESSLLKAVSMNPVSVAIEATGREFQHYQGGVFTGTCGTNLNHAVLVVGYGTEEDGTNYWIVKNSWGFWWGEGGYIRMVRMGFSDPRGKCGINIDASFPIKYSTRSP